MTDYYFPHAGTIALARKSKAPEEDRWHAQFTASPREYTTGFMLTLPSTWRGRDSVISVALDALNDVLVKERSEPMRLVADKLRAYSRDLIYGHPSVDLATQYQTTRALFFERPVRDELQPRVHSLDEAKASARSCADASRRQDSTVTTYDVPVWRWDATDPHIILRVGKRGGVTTHKSEENQA